MRGAFKSSAKGAAVAKAFARILEKTRPDDRGLSILSVRSTRCICKSENLKDHCSEIASLVSSYHLLPILSWNCPHTTSRGGHMVDYL